MTTYGVYWCSVNWGDRYALSAAHNHYCGHKHRSVETAIKCDNRSQPRGGKTWYATRILAHADDVGLRFLSEVESDKAGGLR